MKETKLFELWQGHLQYRPGCTTLCGWLIQSFSSVIKTFLQYRGYTFYEWIIHKNQPHVCKIQGRPRPIAVEGLGCDRHWDETVTLTKHVTKYKYMRKWMVEFLSKSPSHVIKIALVNSIRMTKSIKLTLIFCVPFFAMTSSRVLVFSWGHLLFHHGPNTPALLYQPIQWKKRKGKQEETKREQAARPIKRHCSAIETSQSHTI